MRARSLYLLLLVRLLVLLFLRPRAGEDDDDDLNFPPGGICSRWGRARHRIIIIVSRCCCCCCCTQEEKKKKREREKERERGESSYLYVCESCVSVSLDYSKCFSYGVYVRTTTQRAARILTGKNESFPNKKKEHKTKMRTKIVRAFFLLSSRSEDCVSHISSVF